MINRVCISINNRCNLNCKYCHFHEKKDSIQSDEMNVMTILDNIMHYIDCNSIEMFKLGFVGNGEPLLEYDALEEYILHISEYLADGRIVAYSITNGLLVDEYMLEFFTKHKVNLGFSIDGLPSIHDMYRCKTHAKVMKKIELYRMINGKYPPMNCTVGKEVLQKADETIEFFKQFDTRVTFSRMIGKYGIALKEFNEFLKKADQRLNVRTGSYDCTMYGGFCGAGMNNFFYANGKIYLCGNCVDLPALGKSSMPISELEKVSLVFDRTHCYKETICE